jgi:hypothetical protein
MSQPYASLVSTPGETARQTGNSIARLPDGGWITSWEGHTAPGDTGGESEKYLRFQRFDSDGEAVGDVVTVASEVNSQNTPVRSTVTALADGSWVVTWTLFSIKTTIEEDENGQPVPVSHNDQDVWQQKYDANGNASGDSVLVNTTTEGFQDYPSTTALEDGGWLVSWTCREPLASGGYQEDVIFQKFDSEGNRVGGEIDLDTSTATKTINDSNSVVKPLDGGGWLAVWKAGGGDIKFAIYDADGERTGGPYSNGVSFNLLGTRTSYDAAVLDDGRVLLAWTSSNGFSNGGESFTVQQRLFDTNGNAESSTLQVSTSTMSDNVGGVRNYMAPSTKVVALEDGGWVAVWLYSKDGGPEKAIYQQRFDSDGHKVGSEDIAASFINGYSDGYDVTATNDGGWIITFNDSRSGTSGTWDWDTYQLRFDAQGTVYGVNDAPEGVDVAKTILEDSPYSFTIADFSFKDRDGDTLSGVIIDTLPANGTLTLDGEAVSAGQQIATADLDKLVWTPAANASGANLANFKFRVVDSGDASQPGYTSDISANTFAFNVTSVNDAPVVADAAAELYADLTYIYNPLLTATDADGDTLKITSVTNSTGLGKVTIVQNRLVFDPGKAFANLAEGQSSDVVIHYTVSDGRGGVTTATWTLTVHSALDVHLCEGTDSNDNLTGSIKNDLLLGYDGDDVLNGGTGADDLVGGDGNDSYVIDKATDTVTEESNEGTDTVNASVTYSLATYGDVENITLTGKAAIGATGNDEDNILTGNTGANKLTAGAGDDKLIGGAGADTMAGGEGEDTYIVDNAGDRIVETVGSEIDEVQALVSYSIAKYAYVDNIILTGVGKANATGNAIANVLIGNANVNTLNGGAGNDTLDAGKGNDILIGGLGNDTFVFETGYGKEAISDFSASGATQDIIDLRGLEAYSSFDELSSHITQIKTGVFIDFGGGDSMLLTKQKLINIDASDFDF